MGHVIRVLDSHQRLDERHFRILISFMQNSRLKSEANVRAVCVVSDLPAEFMFQRKTVAMFCMK